MVCVCCIGFRDLFYYLDCAEIKAAAAYRATGTVFAATINAANQKAEPFSSFSTSLVSR